MILDAFKAVILGAIEGITEFLPVSSTGHLIIVNRWITFSPEFTKTFDIVIQIGAILAIVYLFRKRLFIPFPVNLWKKICIAVIPALILGALFGDVIQAALFNATVVAIALVVGGVIMIFAERMNKTVQTDAAEDISVKTALKIGAIQCLALIPGTSRSAASIIGGLFLGLSRKASAEFSFFLAIPTLAAASGYSLLKEGFNLDMREGLLLVIGFAGAFIVALVVVKAFMKYIQTRNFTLFAYYRIILGIIILCLNIF
jgi:undecaprenyl-diphosphatase